MVCPPEAFRAFHSSWLISSIDMKSADKKGTYLTRMGYEAVGPELDAADVCMTHDLTQAARKDQDFYIVVQQVLYKKKKMWWPTHLCAAEVVKTNPDLKEEADAWAAEYRKKLLSPQSSEKGGGGQLKLIRS